MKYIHKYSSVSAPFLKFIFKLGDDCFTVLYWFLHKTMLVSHSFIYIYIYMDPSSHFSRSSQSTWLGSLCCLAASH